MKILLVAPSDGILGHIAGWISAAFKTSGHEVKEFDFRRQLPAYLKKILEFAGLDMAQRMNSSLLREASDFNPDLVLVLLGENISAETLKQLKSRAGTVLANWFHDTVVSKYRKEFLSVYPAFYDYFFIIDLEKAVKESGSVSGNYVRLPLACDRNEHRTLNLSKKEEKIFGSEVAFVGTVVPVREPLLESIADLGLSIWGPRASILGDWTGTNPVLKNCYRGGPFKNYAPVVKIFNGAKIVVNIHGLQGEKHYDASSRIFETAGCGAFQIAEYNEGLLDCFENGREIVFYKTKEELRELVKYYLAHENERKVIALAGQQRAYKEHTFKVRIEKLTGLISARKL